MNITGRDIPQKPSQVGNQLDSLRKGIEEVHRRIDQMNDKISRVLLPIPPTDMNKKACEPPQGVPMANELQILSQKTWEAVERMDDLISRIDI